MEALRVVAAAIVLVVIIMSASADAALIPKSIPRRQATEVEKKWCVPRSTASDAALVMCIERACSQGADCGPIKPGGRCFAGGLAFQAAYVMNSAYKKAGGAPSNCDYSGVGHVTHTYPGTPGCVFV